MRTQYFLMLSGLAMAAVLAVGCASTDNKIGAAGSAPDGSKLWAQNCMRCHNARPPDSYSDAQWEVALMHMRIRANLTAEEHHAILNYLQSDD